MIPRPDGVLSHPLPSSHAMPQTELQSCRAAEYISSFCPLPPSLSPPRGYREFLSLFPSSPHTPFNSLSAIYLFIYLSCITLILMRRPHIYRVASGRDVRRSTPGGNAQCTTLIYVDQIPSTGLFCLFRTWRRSLYVFVHTREGPRVSVLVYVWPWRCIHRYIGTVARMSSLGIGTGSSTTTTTTAMGIRIVLIHSPLLLSPRPRSRSRSACVCEHQSLHR